MKMYDPKNGGFYDPAVHGKSIPPGSISISDKRYTELLEGQSSGMEICRGEKGVPELRVRSPSPEQTKSSSIMDARRKLSETDYVVIRAMERGEILDPEFVRMRDELRKIVSDKIPE